MTKTQTSKNLLVNMTAIATLALVAVGCGEASTVGGTGSGTMPGTTAPGSQTTRSTTLLPDTEFTQDLEIYDTVTPVDHSVAAQMTKTDTQITMPANLGADYDIGDVLVSDYADGIFRVIEGMSVEGGQLVLTTRPAALEDAIASGQIYLAKLTDPSLTPPPAFAEGMSTQQMMLRRQGLGFTKDFGWQGSLYEYNQSFNDQLNQAIPGDTLQVTASNINAAIGAEFYAEITAKLGWPPVSIPTARVMANGRADATLRLKLQSDEEFHYDETFMLVGDRSANPFVTVNDIDHTLLPGIFPLKISFAVSSELQVRADVDGAIEAEFGYTLAASASGGLERKSGEWVWVRETELEPLRFGPVFRGEKNLTASAKLTNKVRLTLGEKANGFLELEPATANANFSQQIDADSGQCPTSFDLRAKGSIEGQLASIDLPFIGNQTIMDSSQSYTLYDKHLVDYDSQLELPGVCDPNYEPPMHAGTLPAGHKCGGDNECISAKCYQNTCVHTGVLRVSSAWQDDTDLDLHVETPEGNTIYWEKRNIDGGSYDFHNCTGECVNPAPHVESVYFEEVAQDGTYKVYLIHEKARAATSFEIEVEYNGDTIEFAGDVPQESGFETPAFEFTVGPDGVTSGMSTMGGRPQG